MAASNGSAAERGAPDVDAVVVGAGFSGLYMLYRLRQAGFSTKVIESADDIGGTWYWNRYPGARCDIQSIDYSYSFDPELETEWTWSEKYATQPEILRYLDHVATKHDLRRDIEFSTRIDSATWDDDASVWQLRTSNGDDISCRWYIMATGCLSLPKTPDIPGVERYRGATYFTGKWPHEGVDFTGKRVAVIGTGSSGIQSIPLIAEQAAELTVFQRTPNYSMPAHNGPIPDDKAAAIAGRHAEYRHEAKYSRGGVPGEISQVMTMSVSEEERQAAFESAWQAGELFASLTVFADVLVNPEANEHLCEFVRNKIRTIVKDPVTAEMLCPKDHPYGTKRPCLDTNYYATFNLPHVRLVDLRATPITTITETGIETATDTFEVDAIVFATGFDAMTGPIVAVDVTGREGESLKEKWVDGPKTYLGLTTAGFPNFFMITGPGSPSVLSNMAVSIEQHVDWIGDCLEHMRSEGLQVIEPTPLAESAWGVHVNDCADITLYPQANSWYMGANVPGKPRVFLPYVGGVDVYRIACNEVAERDYLGFSFEGADGSTRCNDGVIRSLQPDVAMVLDLMATLNLPTMDTMSPEDARTFSETMSAARPPGPDVGEIVDGVMPGAAGDLDYRLYRPATPGPHPVVVYYHGGGWVIGNQISDDPFCRDLCVRADALIISVNYRHAPEDRFPAAAEDGFAVLKWVAENAESLGGDPARVAVAGWSAGANIAAVVSQLARDAGGPAIVGQLLVTPVTDCDMSRESYIANADGYMLTKALMTWFWDHYADPEDRSNPMASPLRAESLADLPPALVVTCEFDPLRDEGTAYAAALADAGNEVRHLPCRGHTHTSLTSVDMILSGAPVRAEMADALRQFFGVTVPA